MSGQGGSAGTKGKMRGNSGVRFGGICNMQAARRRPKKSYPGNLQSKPTRQCRPRLAGGGRPGLSRVPLVGLKLGPCMLAQPPGFPPFVT